MKDILRFLDFKNWLKLLKKIMRTRTQLQFYMTVQSERYYLLGAKFNNTCTSRNNWKPLFEVNFVRILLQQLDYSNSISIIS